MIAASSGAPSVFNPQAILLLCLTTALAGCSIGGGAAAKTEEQTSNALLRVAVTRPETLKMERALNLTGEFGAWQQADLHAKIAGYLKTLNVDIGSRVQAGQLIAVLEAPELLADRIEADAAVQRARSEEIRARAVIDRAKAQLEVAKTAHARLLEVNRKEKGLVAGQELDEALARRQAAEAEVAHSEAALESSRQAIQAAKARLDRFQAMLAYTRIEAPFAGVVTKRYVDPGNMVQAGTSSQTQAVPVVQLASISKLRLSVVVPESAVPDVHVGTEVDIRVPSIRKDFKGRIARFAEQVATSSRTMLAEIDVPNSHGAISPGMIAEVRLNTMSTRDVLAIPVQAISRRGGQSYVLTVDAQNRVGERQIRSGLESASHIEVVEGLAENDRVIVGAKTLIQPGQTVEAAEGVSN